MLSEMHKRGKVRDIQAKKYLSDIKNNLEKQCTKIIKQVKNEKDKLFEPDGIIG